MNKIILLNNNNNDTSIGVVESVRTRCQTYTWVTDEYGPNQQDLEVCNITKIPLVFWPTLFLTFLWWPCGGAVDNLWFGSGKLECTTQIPSFQDIFGQINIICVGSGPQMFWYFTSKVLPVVVMCRSPNLEGLKQTNIQLYFHFSTLICHSYAHTDF